MYRKVSTNFNFVDRELEVAKEWKKNKVFERSIKENAPASYRTRDRIVTLNDYSDLLRINFYDFLCLNTTRDKDDRKLAHIFYMMKDGYEMNQDLVSRVTEFIAALTSAMSYCDCRTLEHFIGGQELVVNSYGVLNTVNATNQ